jgi:hypothetical protein
MAEQPKWPTCLDNLTPSPQKPGKKPPAEIVKVFRAAGWPDKVEFPVRLVAMLGTCSTRLYQDCPTMPEWHRDNAESEGEDFLDEIGAYNWCDFDILDKAGTCTALRMTYNNGDADCNDGTWGVVWDRETAKVVANLTSVGDCLGRVEAVSKAQLKSFVPHEWPVPTERDQFEECQLPFSLEFGHDSPFEKLIAIAMRWCHAVRHG